MALGFALALRFGRVAAFGLAGSGALGIGGGGMGVLGIQGWVSP
ncbi:MAG TPA: hypothetical protein VFR64_22495 [Methylomirabilota bacterium]|nr:hypothetical protein [Methylomirabilota bacterium]